jgi:hypothetical protein
MAFQTAAQVFDPVKPEAKRCYYNSLALLTSELWLNGGVHTAAYRVTVDWAIADSASKRMQQAEARCT